MSVGDMGHTERYMTVSSNGPSLLPLARQFLWQMSYALVYLRITE